MSRKTVTEDLFFSKFFLRTFQPILKNTDLKEATDSFIYLIINKIIEYEYYRNLHSNYSDKVLRKELGLGAILFQYLGRGGRQDLQDKILSNESNEKYLNKQDKIRISNYHGGETYKFHLISEREESDSKTAGIFCIGKQGDRVQYKINIIGWQTLAGEITEKQLQSHLGLEFKIPETINQDTLKSLARAISVVKEQEIIQQLQQVEEPTSEQALELHLWTSVRTTIAGPEDFLHKYLQMEPVIDSDDFFNRIFSLCDLPSSLTELNFVDAIPAGFSLDDLVKNELKNQVKFLVEFSNSPMFNNDFPNLTGVLTKKLIGYLQNISENSKDQDNLVVLVNWDSRRLKLVRILERMGNNNPRENNDFLDLLTVAEPDAKNSSYEDAIYLQIINELYDSAKPAVQKEFDAFFQNIQNKTYSGDKAELVQHLLAVHQAKKHQAQHWRRSAFDRSLHNLPGATFEVFARQDQILEIFSQLESKGESKSNPEIKHWLHQTGNIHAQQFWHIITDMGINRAVADKIVKAPQLDITFLFKEINALQGRVSISQLHNFCLVALPAVWQPPIDAGLSQQTVALTKQLFKAFIDKYTANAKQINNKNFIFNRKTTGITRVENLGKFFDKLDDKTQDPRKHLLKQAMTMTLFLKHGTLGEAAGLDYGKSNTDQDSARAYLLRELKLNLSVNQIMNYREDQLFKIISNQLQLLTLLQPFKTLLASEHADEKQFPRCFADSYSKNVDLIAQLRETHPQIELKVDNESWFREQVYQAMAGEGNFAGFEKIFKKNEFKENDSLRKYYLFSIYTTARRQATPEQLQTRQFVELSTRLTQAMKIADVANAVGEIELAFECFLERIPSESTRSCLGFFSRAVDIHNLYEEIHANCKSAGVFTVRESSILTLDN